jgi:DNA-binding response OmpR family regulator
MMKPESSERTDCTPKRVLIVEDSLPMLRSLERVLVAEGYVPHPVQTAEEAFHELRHHSFHAVVADYELGTTRGDEVL